MESCNWKKQQCQPILYTQFSFFCHICFIGTGEVYHFPLALSRAFLLFSIAFLPKSLSSVSFLKYEAVELHLNVHVSLLFSSGIQCVTKNLIFRHFRLIHFGLRSFIITDSHLSFHESSQSSAFYSGKYHLYHFCQVYNPFFYTLLFLQFLHKVYD